MHEYRILEWWNEELNVKKIIAVIDATFAVAERKPEKNLGLYGIRTLDPLRHWWGTLTS